MQRHPVLRLLLAFVSFSFFFPFGLSAQSYGDFPLSFEPNAGQSTLEVQFLSHGKGYVIFLTADSATLRLGTQNPQTLQLKVANGQTPSRVVGEDHLAGSVNYLRGSDQARWLRNLPTYSRVRMTDIYPGIDLIYYGNHRQLEYDFVVHPGADASRTALVTNGVELALEANGGLTMKAGPAALHWHAPIAYQLVQGQRHSVSARYKISGATVRFVIGKYDHAHDLVIDPVLVYSSYVGGNGGDIGDVGNAIAVDAAGNAFVAGVAASTNFPTTAKAVQPAPRGDDDAFVAKLNPQGTAYVYSTYLGGGGQDIAWGIAVDSAGEAFVTGQTGSGLHGTSPFPTTAGAYQRAANQATLNSNVFVAKLSADGADLLYATYLSGSNDSSASGIAVDAGGNAYVITNTASGFPVTNRAYQKTAGTDTCPYEQFADGLAQAVTKLDPTGSSLVYSTYVGHGCDYGAGIAVNSNGEAYITGHTQDFAYPVTAGAAQTKFGGVVDGFVTRLNAAGTGLIYSTFLGGPLPDFSNSIALDSSGYVYVAGGTDGNFPTTESAYQRTAANNGFRKGFITKLSPMGKALVYSTYVRGASNVSFNGIAVDKSHNAYVTGYTDGKQYPVTSTSEQRICFAASSGCLTQAVVSKLNAAGNALLYSSYFGASDASNNYFPGDIGNGIGIDGAGDFYITGRTSNGLKTTASAVEHGYRSTSSSTDAFVAKFGTAASSTQVRISAPANGATVSSPVKVSATATGGTVGWMQIYADGQRKAQVAGGTVNTTFTLTVGRHRITAQAIDKDGSVAKSTVYVTVK